MRGTLAFSPHADDVEWACGGSLFRVDAPLTIAVAVADYRDDHITRTRHREQARAAALVGATVRWGRWRDGELAQTTDSVEWATQCLADTMPSLVLFPWGDDTHQDHRALTHMVRAALRTCPTVEALMYIATSSHGACPDTYIDISLVMDGKSALLAAHQSQQARLPSPTHTTAMARAMTVPFRDGLQYAEGFVTYRRVRACG